MASKESDTGYELPEGFSKQTVFRIFGFTTAEELEQFLQKCPRHYLRSYFAEVFLGSPDKVGEIRSNNDKYLLNKLVQAIQAVGIPINISAGKRAKAKAEKPSTGGKAAAAPASAATCKTPSSQPQIAPRGMQYSMAARAGPDAGQGFPGNPAFAPVHFPNLAANPHMIHASAFQQGRGTEPALGASGVPYLAAALSNLTHQQLSSLLLQSLVQNGAGHPILGQLPPAMLVRMLQQEAMAAGMRPPACSTAAVAGSAFVAVGGSGTVPKRQEDPLRERGEQRGPVDAEMLQTTTDAPSESTSLTISETPTAATHSRASVSGELGRSSLPLRAEMSDGSPPIDSHMEDADQPGRSHPRSGGHARQKRSQTFKMDAELRAPEADRGPNGDPGSSSAFQALLDVAHAARRQQQ